MSSAASSVSACCFFRHLQVDRCWQVFDGLFCGWVDCNPSHLGTCTGALHSSLAQQQWQLQLQQHCIAATQCSSGSGNCSSQTQQEGSLTSLMLQQLYTTAKAALAAAAAAV